MTQPFHTGPLYPFTFQGIAYSPFETACVLKRADGSPEHKVDPGRPVRWDGAVRCGAVVLSVLSGEPRFSGEPANLKRLLF